MAPQKRVLETEYGIKFPTKKVRSESPCSFESDHLYSDEQTQNHYRMALKLQQRELESESSDLALIDDNTCSVLDQSLKEALQLEADAAAALMHLKPRK